ncbi:MAG: hypothetical protein WCR72_10620 [Bacteroidota bacterium]
MEFTPEQIEIIENLAGINYTIRQLAMYLDLSEALLYTEYANKDSLLAYHYDRGKLIASADIDMSLLKDAKNGNLTAAAMFKKSEKATRINNLKNELFGN